MPGCARRSAGSCGDEHARMSCPGTLSQPRPHRSGRACPATIEVIDKRVRSLPATINKLLKAGRSPSFGIALLFFESDLMTIYIVILVYATLSS